MKGKCIYEPGAKASEYGKYAASLFVNCSNSCEYCYLRKGRFAKVLGGNTPTLKKCFQNGKHALYQFNKELTANLPELQERGLFFSFTSDIFLPETAPLNISAINLCIENEVPVAILTKRADWDTLWNKYCMRIKRDVIRLVSFGFTLTGRDDMEPGASTNAERIKAMRKLHKAGFRTWSSIEPIIDFDSSLQMIGETAGICDHYKVGLLKGAKYDNTALRAFVNQSLFFSRGSTFYFKDSLLKAAGIERITIELCSRQGF